MDTSLPAGPPLPAWAQTLAYATRPLTFLEACHRRYGDRFTVRILGEAPIVYLVDPADVRAVFRGDPATFRAGEANAVLAGILGPRSVLVTDGAEHAAARRRLTPAFHGDSVTRQVEVMADVAAEAVETWPVGREFAVAPRMRAITLEVILRTVIGAHDGDRLAELRRVLPPMVELDGLATMALLRPGLRRRWPWRRQDAVLRRARAVLDAEIARTRRDPGLSRRPDVLAMLVRAAAGGDCGDDVDDGELRDQIVTLLLAGHETTATALSWTLEQLVRHPLVLERARDAADRGDDRCLEAVIDESLRLRPVVPDVGRALGAPTEIGGHRLPAGTVVAPAVALIQRSTERCPDARTFRPERYAEDRPDPSTWLPFGGGNRRCLGATFATTEMRVVLGEILRCVELAPTDAAPEAPRARHVTLVPHRGARVLVRKRRPAGSRPVIRPSARPTPGR